MQLIFIRSQFFLDFPRIRPIVIAIWCGEGKCVLNEYLAQFVEELNQLLRTGIKINNYTIRIKIKCFICDTPARAYIKGILKRKKIPWEKSVSQFDIELNYRYYASQCNRRMPEMYHIWPTHKKSNELP